MRTVRHWTPRYIYSRIGLMWFEHANPKAPWITPEAVRHLESMIRSCDHGVEFGSGRSTIWFAERVDHLTSVEHNEEWYTKLSSSLKNHALTNVDYNFAPSDPQGSNEETSEYVQIALSFPEQSVDFALIDGLYRECTAKFIIPKIKPGGLLIIDDANWFLPSRSHAPASRDIASGPDGPVWAEVWRILSKWRIIWTSSGVTDTAIFVKP